MSLAACGSEQATSSPDDKATTSVQPSKTTTAQNQVTVQVKASPQSKAKSWTLTCDPVGGDHPKADNACAALAKQRDPFKAPPRDQMCTKIYGGPETATVKGTWQGKPVNATFGRSDGCQLHRWSTLKPLFGDVPKVR